jgi:hypothetical protein
MRRRQAFMVPYRMLGISLRAPLLNIRLLAQDMTQQIFMATRSRSLRRKKVAPGKQAFGVMFLTTAIWVGGGMLEMIGISTLNLSIPILPT